ncbi:hypothetical protein GHK92_11240 [Nocardioides sp. dk4132]|uniref:hypothetical protein n=1 Tax=unclassified Nocardioides TaxID=2615069 RepID=UPI001294EDFE|nr:MULTISPECIES: hypothetical protein [unclassified Nocardioides]MQW76451.1 hypothetical protein [Nocardioides sp. dk4132]QGA07280.1 hypothetical protein GFH29_07695 [Nocardioides sp. dk884]
MTVEREVLVVIKLDRLVRAKRRNDAKSDPLEAARAAREALPPPRPCTPRVGGTRQALSALLSTRRSAVKTATDARYQLFALTIAAPQQIRDRFASQKLPVVCARRPPRRSSSSRPLPRRLETSGREALVLERAFE